MAKTMPSWRDSARGAAAAVPPGLPPPASAAVPRAWSPAIVPRAWKWVIRNSDR